MTTSNNTTVQISREQYADLIRINRAIIDLATFFEESDIDFSATDLSYRLNSSFAFAVLSSFFDLPT